MSIEGKMIVLGVSGGIAAYKACTLCSQLSQRGANVKVIMTRSATEFVRPLTFQSLSRNHVYVDTFEEQDPNVISHIDLADHADLFLIAPATANVIGKLANGLADDMLSTTLLATEAPVWMAPAMNGHMYDHPAVQDNLLKLKKRGVHLLQPGEGQLACGYVGKGRLSEPEEMIAAVEQYFHSSSLSRQASGWWKGKKVLITAGPTQEKIDPVRYISNYSSGKMGYALAEGAQRLGAEVTLVSGPTRLEVPEHVRLVQTTSTEDMYEAVKQEYAHTDVVIKSAAVADYKPAQTKEHKIKKNGDELTLTLTKTPDILKELGKQKRHQILVGFAAESHNMEQFAQEKMQNKNLDFIVANNITEEGAGFASDMNRVQMYGPDGSKREWPLMDKKELALEILYTVADQSE